MKMDNSQFTGTNKARMVKNKTTNIPIIIHF